MEEKLDEKKGVKNSLRFGRKAISNLDQISGEIFKDSAVIKNMHCY